MSCGAGLAQAVSWALVEREGVLSLFLLIVGSGEPTRLFFIEGFCKLLYIYSWIVFSKSLGAGMDKHTEINTSIMATDLVSLRSRWWATAPSSYHSYPPHHLSLFVLEPSAEQRTSQHSRVTEPVDIMFMKILQ